MPGTIDTNREYSKEVKDAINDTLKDLEDNKLDGKYLDGNWKQEIVKISFEETTARVAKEFSDLWAKTTQNGEKWNKLKAANDAIIGNKTEAIKKTFSDLQSEWTTEHITKSPNTTEKKENSLSPDEQALKDTDSLIFNLEQANKPKTEAEIKEALKKDAIEKHAFLKDYFENTKAHNVKDSVVKWTDNDYSVFVQIYILTNNKIYLEIFQSYHQGGMSDFNKIRKKAVDDFMEKRLTEIIDNRYQKYQDTKDELKNKQNKKPE